MIEETNSASTPAQVVTSGRKVYRIGLYNRLAIIISGVLIAISLMSGWALWLTISRTAINNYINQFNNLLPNNSNLKIAFNELSIIVFIISGLALVLAVIPFIFIKTKNSRSALFSLLSFIFALIIVIVFALFLFIRFDTFLFLINKKDNQQVNTTTNLIIAFLPWFLVALFALFLLGNSIWLTINITSKYKSNALIMPITKPITKTTIIEEIIQENDSITIPTTVEPVVSPIINNERENKLAVNVEQPTIYNNLEKPEAATSNVGAYSSEAVPTTKDTINPANQQPAISETILPESTIYTQFTNSNENTPPDDQSTTINDNYQSENQGGFDIQGLDSQPEMANFNQQPLNAPEVKDEKKVMMQVGPEPAKININNWTLEQIQTVWEKAEPIDGVSDKLYRKDYSGAWMFRDSFTNNFDEANNQKTYSWTIVLHRPNSQGGTTELYNLDPMNIVNAKSKGENYPRWTTKLSSKGNENIFKEQTWKART